MKSAEEILTKEQLKSLKDAGFVVVHDSAKPMKSRISSAVYHNQHPECVSFEEVWSNAIGLSISIQNEGKND